MTRRALPKTFLICAAAIVLLAAGLGLAWRAGVFLPLLPGPGPAQADPVAAAADSADVAAGEETSEPAVPVEVAPVARRAVAAFHRAASTVEADRLVEVTCQAAGRVREVRAEAGDWVAAGAVLAVLENDRQKVELRRAELALAEQRRKLTRARQMLAEELISEEEFEAARAAQDQAQADHDLAAIAVAETYVGAPFAGQVTDRRVVAGQQVTAGAAAFTLADFTPLRVRVHLPETVAAKVTAGVTVPVATETGPEEIDATVERISPVVDPQTGTVRVTLRLPPDASARVGGFVKARLVTDRKHDVLAVPKRALVQEGGLRSVFVAAADTVRKVEVTTGLYDATHIEVTSGLQEGWQVVTLGRGGLRTGSRVEILPPSGLGELAAR
jgi:membrane fusion protein (multidrug efflux system)